MDQYQYDNLEREVREHGARIAQIKASLRDLEENLAKVTAPPPQIAKQAAALKMELRGRTAAFAVGSAHLQMQEHVE